jgi:hypothetical protein
VRDSASFRDLSGHIFYKGDSIFRGINYSFKENYDFLINSGLYQQLIQHELLIPHAEVNENDAFYKTIQPQKIEFISYPYEWTFGQWKDAALLTLDVQILSLNNGMSLKDASSFNVQFNNGRAVFIDTLSFEKYVDNIPWKAFGQFTKHFLGPLVLMNYTTNEMGKFFKNYIDGIPVEIVSKLLPLRSYFNINVLLSIHLQARYVKNAKDNLKVIHPNLSLKSLLNMLTMIRQFILGMKPIKSSYWINYYESNSYLKLEDSQKKQLVEQTMQKFNPETVWDLGCNTGAYSLIASANNASVIAFDSDHDSVENLYKYVNINKLNVLPLVMDFSNPSSAIGWAECERKSLSKRGPAEMVLALALIHHLRITEGIPLQEIALWLINIVSKALVIEFIPKNDPQVKRLLLNREDVFEDYSINEFEKIFSNLFRLISKDLITETGRVIFIYEK